MIVFKQIILIINYMSIMNNCLEYLLGVAEKIIVKCADTQTINKYNALKDQVLSKYNLQTQNSHISVLSSDKENNKSVGIMRNSVINKSISISKISNNKSRKSMGKSREKNKNKDQLENGRIQSFTSTGKMKIIEHRKTECNDQYSALLHLTALIKNAEACPNMLKTITFQPNSFNEQVNELFRSISQSLNAIYNSGDQQKQNQRKLTEIDSSLHLDYDQLYSDNKWLTNKLQIMVEQNSVLRRIVGHKSN